MKYAELTDGSLNGKFELGIIGMDSTLRKHIF